MSDSEQETTANVQSLENERLDRILEQADNSDDTLYTVCPTCIDELSVSTYREQLQEEGFCMETFEEKTWYRFELSGPCAGDNRDNA